MSQSSPAPRTEHRALTIPQFSAAYGPARSSVYKMIADAFINVEQWLASKVAIAFAKEEGTAFVNGNGIVKPKGLLTYPIVADASWAWGSIGYIPTGTSGGFTPVSAGPPIVQGGDVLFDVVGALTYDYRPNARWIMNRKTVAACRKLKNLNGDYIWQDRLIPGQPNMLCGFPVTEVEDMPDVAANSYSIAFGDFRQAYQVIDPSAFAFCAIRSRRKAS